MTRWLLKGLIDDHIQLTAQQRRAVHGRIRQMFNAHWWVTGALTPGMVAVMAIAFWSHIASRWPLAWRIGAELLFVAVVLAILALVFRRMYVRYAWTAIRELGFADICAKCGYNFTGLPAEHKACPECNARRNLFTPADWSPEAEQQRTLE